MGLGIGTGCLQARLGGPGASWGLIAQQRIPGVPVLEALQGPGSSPPSALHPAFWGSPDGPAVVGLEAPYSAMGLRSRCSQEPPSPTVPSSLASPPTTLSGLQLSLCPPCWSSLTPFPRVLTPHHPGRQSPGALMGFSPHPGSSPSQGSLLGLPYRDWIPLLLPYLQPGMMGGGDPGILWLQSLPEVPTGSFSAPDLTPRPCPLETPAPRTQAPSLPAPM